MPGSFRYGIDTLTVSAVLDICSGNRKGILSSEAIAAINTSAAYVQEIVDNNKVVYGINTGFGILSDKLISPEDTAILQHKLLQSHSVGVGDPVPVEISKLMMICKVHSLAHGFSGIRLATLERILWHIEKDIIPVVPEKGKFIHA